MSRKPPLPAQPSDEERRAHAGRMIEVIIRGWITRAAMLIALVLVGTGLGSWTQPWVFLGPVVGLLGAGLAFLSLRAKWPPALAWTAVIGVLGASITVLVLILFRP